MTELNLKHFQCHRKVHAVQMTLGEFAKQTGRSFDKSVSDTAEGYLVVYNHGSDTEYRSWSPKAEFEANFTLLPEAE